MWFYNIARNLILCHILDISNLIVGSTDFGVYLNVNNYFNHHFEILVHKKFERMLENTILVLSLAFVQGRNSTHTKFQQDRSKLTRLAIIVGQSH